MKVYNKTLIFFNHTVHLSGLSLLKQRER